MIQSISRNYAIIRDDVPAGLTVTAFGDIDFAVAPELQEALLDGYDQQSVVIVDLSECRYVGAAVISVLVRARIALGDRLAVIAPVGCAARRLLALVALEHVFTLIDPPRPWWLGMARAC